MKIWVNKFCWKESKRFIQWYNNADMSFLLFQAYFIPTDFSTDFQQTNMMTNQNSNRSEDCSANFQFFFISIEQHVKTFWWKTKKARTPESIITERIHFCKKYNYFQGIPHQFRTQVCIHIAIWNLAWAGI